MKQLFQYVVILDEYTEPDAAATSTAKAYKDSKMIIEPKYILAKSEKDVIFKVTREIPEEHADNPDNVRIIVRSF